MRARVRRPVSALIRLDLPTLERPAKAISVRLMGGSAGRFVTPATKRHSWANSLLPAATCSGPGAVSGSGAAGAGAASFRALLPSGLDPHAPHDEPLLGDRQEVVPRPRSE